MVTVRIWDLPTRLFHWLLAGCVFGLLITGLSGGDAMFWHFRLGYAVLTLLLFRLVWGFVGGHWSRWPQFPLAPVRVLEHLRGQSERWPGHNPAGSWSVVLMLFWLLLQVSTGLFSDDEIIHAGPLTTWASADTVRAATTWHKGYGKAVLIALVVMHLIAIAWYHLRKRVMLLPSMLHGHKSLPNEIPASRDDWSQRLLALLIILACGAVVVWMASLGSV